jgi:hypothetical protein
MFTTGQTVFALLFLLVFVLVMVRMYRKDSAWQKRQYKGAGWVLIFFLGFVTLLVLMKYLLRQ